MFRGERDGFRLTAARTLSLDPRYRQLSVRRLITMIMLELERRGAVARCSSRTRRTCGLVVAHRLTEFLRGPVPQGAFAGDTERSSFFVRCDDALNPPQSQALGRWSRRWEWRRPARWSTWCCGSARTSRHQHRYAGNCARHRGVNLAGVPQRRRRPGSRCRERGSDECREGAELVQTFRFAISLTAASGPVPADSPAWGSGTSPSAPGWSWRPTSGSTSRAAATTA